MSRVFILGAGFSRQAGMPLATELTSSILDARLLRNDEEAQQWATNLGKRIETLQGKAGDDFRLNVEQLFDYALFDEELWRMRQQQVRVGRSDGQTPWRQAEKIVAWLRLMEYELAGIIWERQWKADLAPIRRFTDRLLGEDKVITFNYDTLVERALSEQDKPWNHGLNDQDRGGTTVLKMHGSTDWLLVGRGDDCNLQDFEKLFSKEDLRVSSQGSAAPNEEEYLWELWGATNALAPNPVIENACACGWSKRDYRLGVAGLGSHKPLHRLPGSAEIWGAALQAIGDASEIFVIGFSMSPYDVMTRFHFSAVLHERQEPPVKAVVVDRNAIGLAPSFHRLFGSPLMLVPQAAEDQNWEQVIG